MKKTEIYLLEDMPDDVYIIRHMLGGDSSPNYKIHNFPLLKTLQTALDLYQPDILLVDLNLPGSLGLDTLVKVKIMAPEVPIIVLTNGDEESLGDRAIQLGAQDFIPKCDLNPGLLKRALRFAKERHSMQCRLENLVSIDELTLVYNRSTYNERINTTIEESSRLNRRFGLLVVDLNNFKLINDNHGHKVGDQILRSVGSKLKEVNRSTDFVARYSGDEFVIILNNIKGADCLNAIAKSHYEKVKGRYFLEINGKVMEINISLSVGGAIFPDHGEEHETLFVKADNARCKAKNEHLGFFISE